MMRIFCAILILAEAAVQGQTFSSGSNGSDGALSYPTPGTYDFDPAALGKDLDGDNVFHFTAINIASGVTLRLRNGPLRGRAVVWLASGAVQIDGTLDLSGETGHAPVGNPADRKPAQPGPGGYAGGVGNWDPNPHTFGLGPGGHTSIGGSGSHATAGGVVGNPPYAPTYGNSYLIPLRGGSGGAGGAPGGANGAFTGRGGGGGGGGAIRIASSVSISVAGVINAGGGSGGNGGGAGSGGAIHLIAPSIAGNGILNTLGGAPSGGTGRVRLEAFQQLFTNAPPTLIGGIPVITWGTPISVPLPASPPTLRVLSIGGVPVPLSPNGLFTIPDVVLSQTTPVTFQIEARNVPLGTVVKLYLYSEVDVDRTLDSTPLAGTVALSTASVTTTLSIGYSRGFVRATW